MHIPTVHYCDKCGYYHSAPECPTCDKFEAEPSSDARDGPRDVITEGDFTVM